MNFKRLEEFLDSLNEREEMPGELAPGSSTVIYMDHKKIFSYSTGYDDIEKKTRVSPDKLYNIYSCSKITTATAAMQLIEQGRMKTDDLLSKYIPAFEDVKVAVKDENGKIVDLRKPARPITVWHLLTMSSGMDYNMFSDPIKKVYDETDGRAPTLKVCEAMAKDPLEFDPGDRYRYSKSLDVMGGVIEAVTGQRFSEYVEENIFHPLGMYDTTYHPDFSRPERFAAQYEFDRENKRPVKNELLYNPHRIGTEFDGGGAGIATTANDYIILLDALANGGVGRNGARILSSYAVDVMRTPALAEHLTKPIFDLDYNRGYRYCFGVRVLTDRAAGANLASLGEFGWDGWKGCLAMIDPSIKLSVFHTQYIEGFHNKIIPPLRNLVYYSLER